MPYPAEAIAQMAAAVDEWLGREDDLATQLNIFAYANPQAREYVQHGLSRRLGFLKHCAERVFEVLPPNTLDADHPALLDATAFLQSFMMNAFGAVDNMAHVWCYERPVLDERGGALRRQDIGLMPRHSVVVATFSNEFQQFLGEKRDWFIYLKDYRDALAHRIPLYIPPKILNLSLPEVIELQAEIEATPPADWRRRTELSTRLMGLGAFEPVMMHSYGEAAQPIMFHAQIIIDFSTIVELGERLMVELRTLRN